MIPHAEPLQPGPERLHATELSADPVTVAVNVCVAPVFSVAAIGETPTETEAGAFTVIVAVADFVGSATDAAVATTAKVAVTVAGAV